MGVLRTTWIVIGLSAVCLADDTGIDRSPLRALEGRWKFLEPGGKVRTSKTVDELWKGTGLTFADGKCVYEKGKEKRTFRVVVETVAGIGKLRFVSQGEIRGDVEALYRIVEGKRLELAYLPHGDLPDQFEEGIVVVFERITERK